MGFWKTKKGVTIGDQYADVLESVVDLGWTKLQKAYPEVMPEQYTETMKFVLGRYNKPTGYVTAVDPKDPTKGNKFVITK